MLIGILTTLIHFIVLSVAYRWWSFSIVCSTLLAFTVAVIFSYVMSYNFTFKSAESHTRSLPKFAITTLIGLSWNVLLMWCLVDLMSLDYIVAFLITTAVVMVNNFILSKLWVFKA